MKKNNADSTEILEIVRVTITSRDSKNGEVDIRAMRFLQDAGFYHLAVNHANQRYIHAKAPQDKEVFFILERLSEIIRINVRGAVGLDSGRVTYLGDLENDGSREVSLESSLFLNWTLVCKEPEPKLIEAIRKSQQTDTS
jgi:hypothetical protein